jgi:hypothetical protein
VPISPFLVPPSGDRRHPCSSRAAGLGLLLCLALGWGCSKQGEGERCDIANADLDCETGLVCLGETQLSIKGRGVALCCPQFAANTTVDACRATASLPAEPDAGLMLPTPEPVVDAGELPPDATPAP